MLIHIVCWKYKAETDTASRLEHIELLKGLPSIIPDIISFKVGSDILDLERSFDTGLVAEFTGRPELDAYTDHPEHRQVAELGKRISDQVVSVDLISSDQ